MNQIWALRDAYLCKEHLLLIRELKIRNQTTNHASLALMTNIPSLKCLRYSVTRRKLNHLSNYRQLQPKNMKVLVLLTRHDQLTNDRAQ